MLRRICIQASSQATITTRRTTSLFIRKSKSDDCRYLRPRPLASTKRARHKELMFRLEIALVGANLLIFLSAAVLPTPPTPAPIACRMKVSHTPFAQLIGTHKMKERTSPFSFAAWFLNIGAFLHVASRDHITRQKTAFWGQFWALYSAILPNEETHRSMSGTTKNRI